MKNQKTKNQTKTDYVYVEKNIYKTGDRYRVRVGHYSSYAESLRKAREAKKLFKAIKTDIPLW